MSIDKKITDWIERVASKLECDEMTRENYTTSKAKEILLGTCLPTALIKVLVENEGAVIELLPSK